MADYEVAITEALTLNEAPSEAAEFAEAISEGLTLNDSPSEAAEFAEAISEGLTLNDSPSEAAEFAESIAEGLTLNDDPKEYLPMPPNEAEGRYRLANDDLERYELYRGIDAEPDFDAAPWETFSSLPATTAAAIMGGVDLRDICILQYKMNDNAANKTVEDTSGQGNTGTSTRNTSVITTAGKINAAFQYDDGEGDKVTPTTPISLNGAIIAWTIACGIRLRDYRPGRPNSIFSDGETKYMTVSDDGASRAISFYAGGAPVVWTGLPAFHNTWRFVIIRSYGTNQVELLIDNVSRGEKTISSLATIKAVGEGSYGALAFYGDIDNFMVFEGKALSSDETAFLYNGGAGTEELAEYAAEYKFTLRKRNKYDLVSRNIGSWRVELDAAGDAEKPLPDAPQNVQIAAKAGGKALVTAQYLYDLNDDYTATDWLIYFTDDGTDPDPAIDEPTIITMVKGRSIAHLSWLSDAADDEDTLKVLVRTRRTDGEDTYDSTNTDIYTATASTQGPAGQEGRAFTGGAAQTM